MSSLIRARLPRLGAVAYIAGAPSLKERLIGQAAGQPRRNQDVVRGPDEGAVSCPVPLGTEVRAGFEQYRDDSLPSRGGPCAQEEPRV